MDTQLLKAYEKAFQTDPTSAFGGIIAFNGTVDVDVIEAMNERKHFVEVLIAPAFTDAAMALLNAKVNLRVLTVPLPEGDSPVYHAGNEACVGGGLLVQTPDAFNVQAADPPDRRSTDPIANRRSAFAYRVAKFR